MEKVPTAFQLFYADQRQKHQAYFARLSALEVTRKIAAAWHQLSDMDKANYVEQMKRLQRDAEARAIANLKNQPRPNYTNIPIEPRLVEDPQGALMAHKNRPRTLMALMGDRPFVPGR